MCIRDSRGSFLLAGVDREIAERAPLGDALPVIAALVKSARLVGRAREPARSARETREGATAARGSPSAAKVVDAIFRVVRERKKPPPAPARDRGGGSRAARRGRARRSGGALGPRRPSFAMRGRAEQPGRFGGSGEARATGQRQKCQVCRGTEKVAVATVRVAANRFAKDSNCLLYTSPSPRDRG